MIFSKLFGMLATSVAVAAIYEEQAGEFDWLQSNIGQVKFVAQSSSAKTAAFVATDANVLASLKIKAGGLNWRQVLPELDSIDLLRLDGQTLVTASSQGSIVRAWHSPDGSLLWESKAFKQPTTPEEQRAIKLRKFPIPAASTETFVDAKFSKEKVIVLGDGKVVSYALNDGSVEWEWIPAEELKCSHLVSSGSEGLQVLCFRASNLEVVELNSATGDEMTTRTLKLAADFTPSSRSIQVLAPNVVVLHKNVLTVVSLAAEGQLQPQQIEIKDLAPSAKLGAATLSGVDVPNRCVLHLPSADLLLKVDSSSPIQVEKTFQRGSKGEVSVLSGFNGALLQTVSFGNRVTFTLLAADATSGAVSVVEEGALANPDRRAVYKGFPVALQSKDGARSFAALLCFEDHSLAAVHGNTALWAREEALASVVSMEFVTLPGTAFVSKSYPDFASRLVTNTNSLLKWIVQAKFLDDGKNLAKTLLSWVDPNFARVRKTSKDSFAATPFEAPSFSEPLVSDSFGLNKLILLVTKPGKLFGIDSASGEILWWKNLVLSPGSTVWRTFKLRADRFVTITRNAAEKSTTFHYFNPRRMIVLNPVVVETYFTDVLLLPFVDSTKSNILLVVDADSNVRSQPSDDLQSQIISENLQSIFFHRVDLEKSQITGFSLIQTGNKFKATEIWAISFPKDIETISDVAYRNDVEVVQSGLRISHATGGASFKYLNSNLMVLATVRRGASSNIGVVPTMKRATDPSVNIYLIDTVTGSVLDKFVHLNGVGPVYVAQTENTVVYHFYNAQAQEFEITAVELYENPTAAITSSSEAPKFSSFTAHLPIVNQQAYVLRSGIRALIPTRTHRGITSKSFLFGLTSNQLLGIPKGMLDPRRPDPKKITQQDQETGVIAYSPEIPTAATMVLSYNQTIANIRAIETADALLESTSLVFVYGLDLFFTRVTPSRTFDMLDEDFNYPFLVATVSLVAGALFVARAIAERKALHNSWA